MNIIDDNFARPCNFIQFHIQMFERKSTVHILYYQAFPKNRNKLFARLAVLELSYCVKVKKILPTINESCNQLKYIGLLTAKMEHLHRNIECTCAHQGGSKLYHTIIKVNYLLWTGPA